MQHTICIGYAKCGTTMLDVVLRESRLVATPSGRKEIKFFVPPQFPAENAYQHYLAAFGGPEALAGKQHTFEASPQYCHQTPEAFKALVARIADVLPAARIVVCLRHPVVRAYSHYVHNLHNFALYGEGVFTPSRKELVRKVPVRSFRQSLVHSGRLMTSYHDYLSVVYEAVGRERVSLFFLESDVLRFRDWMAGVFDDAVADDLGLSNDHPPNAVIPRRPLPNYAVRQGVLYAFGSRKGELADYPDLTAEQTAQVLAARGKWTLRLDRDEMVALTRDFFAEDLEHCAQLTGDERFLRYRDEPPESQRAVLVDEAALLNLHGVGA
ncbi:MAG: sulfotransferase domain-containing protein [Pseudomonadota bacterium]